MKRHANMPTSPKVAPMNGTLRGTVACHWRPRTTATSTVPVTATALAMSAISSNDPRSCPTAYGPIRVPTSRWVPTATADRMARLVTSTGPSWKSKRSHDPT